MKPITATQTRGQAPATLPETIRWLRALLARIRQAERNSRLGRYEGRNSASTGRWMDSDWERYSTTERRLLRAVRGLLVAEHGLATRISENRDAGIPRPELQARLTATRRRLRAVQVDGPPATAAHAPNEVVATRNPGDSGTRVAR
jgi:hypothetical protein